MKFTSLSGRRFSNLNDFLGDKEKQLLLLARKKSIIQRLFLQYKTREIYVYYGTLGMDEDEFERLTAEGKMIHGAVVQRQISPIFNIIDGYSRLRSHLRASIIDEEDAHRALVLVDVLYKAKDFSRPHFLDIITRICNLVSFYYSNEGITVYVRRNSHAHNLMKERYSKSLSVFEDSFLDPC